MTGSGIVICTPYPHLQVSGIAIVGHSAVVHTFGVSALSFTAPWITVRLSSRSLISTTRVMASEACSKLLLPRANANETLHQDREFKNL